MARTQFCLTYMVATILLAALQLQPVVASDEGTAAPARINKPLVAYWTFDEEFETQCLDSSGNGHDAVPRRQDRGLERTAGLFGGVMRMSGRHMLSVPEKPSFEGLGKVSFSVWTMPTALEKYNEIFRKEDGENRVFFAFQENGTILAFGLNIGGYLEYDAKIDPDRLLDGTWHHCAATFDGQFMRVYLDGKEVGSLKRPGKITAGGSAAGCIGSAGGGENFQGTFDELRIYADALTPEEVALLHQNGLDTLAKMTEHFHADEPKLQQPPVAHWTFNERGSASIIHEISLDKSLKVDAGQNIPRIRGVHGNAVELRGKHALNADFRSP